MPFVGEVVFYALGEDSKQAGKLRPAIVTAVWSDVCVNLQVVIDGANDFTGAYDKPAVWKTSVIRGETFEPGTWNYLSRESEELDIPIAAIASLLSYASDETAESNVEVAEWLRSLSPSIRVEPYS